MSTQQQQHQPGNQSPDGPTGAERSFSFLVNPVSGGGVAPKAVVPIANRLRELGARVEVTFSPNPATSHSVIESAVPRGDVIVSVGGDGNLSSMVGHVAELGGTLGIVPAGRGNDFARMLGIPKDSEELTNLLLHGPAKPIDLIGLTMPGQSEELVAGSVYSGIDSATNIYVEKLRHLPEVMQYPLAIGWAAMTYKPIEALVKINGEAHEFQAATVVVANSAYYGSNMKISPTSKVDDGQLEIVVVEAASRLTMARYMPSVPKGEHIGLDPVHLFTGTEVEFSSRALTDRIVGGDGEPRGPLPGPGEEPAKARVHPGAIKIITP